MDTTDENKSPYERGLQHGYSDHSMDWNEETGRYNPYKPKTADFHEYEKGLNAACEHLCNEIPWA